MPYSERRRLSCQRMPSRSELRRTLVIVQFSRWAAQQGNKALRQLECRLSGCLALPRLTVLRRAEL